MDGVTETTQAVEQGSPEYNALMVDKFDSQTPAQTEQKSERPAWLPEKFSTPEDMARAYGELERKQSTPATTEGAPDFKEAEKAVATAGLDFDTYAQEFSTHGGLTEESYAELASKGFDRDLVDSFIEGQQAIAAGYSDQVLSEVGGGEAYQEMVEWAKSNLSPAEIDAYNQQVESRNIHAARMAVLGLQARFQAVNGREPTLLDGDVTTSSGKAFRSTAEMTAAMRDPRYKTDPAYRQDVADRLAHSDIM